MKKCLLIAILVATFMIVAAFAWGQSIFYEEPFDTAQNWTLDSNWSVTSGALQLSWSPSTDNYDLSATSSDIIVPVSAGDMVVSMYFNDFGGLGTPPETFEVIAVAAGVPTVLWSQATEGDWGVSGGQDLTVSLAPFAGQTIQLKFRSHGERTFNFNYWYIYDIKAYASLNQDLAATSLTGSSTPSINSEHSYVIAVRNTGLSTVSDYTVKLMQTGDVELGSIAGTSIAPQEIIEYTIPWTPTVLGETEIWGKVVFAADENPNNNETNSIIVAVMEAGLLVAEIGTGTAVNTDTGSPSPYGTWYKSFRQQFLYRADDFYAAGAAPGLISALAFNVQDLANCSPMTNYRIRLKHTDQESFSSTFEVGDYTTAWQRDSFMPETGWNVHDLDEPFLWDGASNLIVEIVTDLVTGSYTRNALVYYSPTAFTSSLRYQSDSVNGSTALTGSTLSNRSNIRFFMSPLSDDPQFLVSPAFKDFGDVVLGYSPNQAFRVMNAGGGTLSINSVSISGSAAFTITDPPALPEQIIIGEHVTFHVEYVPTTAGIDTATVTITDNLRNTHTVGLTGNGVDTTIYELSYFEGFDAVTPPDLPMGWSSIYEATAGNGYVKTVTSSPQSPPNCVAMYNPSDINTIALLVAPPLAAAIPTNEVRVKLWGKGNGYSLKVGVMTNPGDPTTFAEVQTLTFTSAWAQHAVSLGTYAGTGKFIAFKHANNSAGQTIYLDTVEFELMGATDLAAIAITGNTSPSVGAATQYTVSVFNNGTAPQSTYTVKLYDGEDLELDTAAGTVTVTPGNAVDVVLSYTPTTEGEMSIYGKVFLDGDINPGNDATDPLTVTVMEAGLLVIGIGNGTETNTETGAPAPYGTWYRAFRQHLLYRADDFYAAGGIPGMISSLAFNVQSLGTCSPMTNFTIRLKATDQEALSTTFDTGEYTTVWQRPSFMPTADWNVHSFDEPFFWDGTSNLIVEIVTDMLTGAYARNALTYYSTTSYNSSLRYNSDSSNGSTGTTGSVSMNRSNIRFFMIPSGGDAVFIVNPSTHDFGDVNLGGSRSRDFTIINAGGEPLGITNISIAGSGTFALSNLPTFPAALETAETVVFTVTYTPSTLSEDTAIVTITDDQDNRHVIGSRGGLRSAPVRDTHTIGLSGTGVNDITIGDGTQTARIPIDFYWNNSIFQTIYTAEDMSNFVGMITGVRFYNNFVSNLTAKPIKIWLGSTTETGLEDGWVSSNDLTLVFDGFVDYPSGQNIISIEFPQMYMHLTGENLIMLVNRPMDTGWHSSSDYFYCQSEGDTSRSRNEYSDSTTFDPAAMTGGTASAQFPKTTFVVIPGGVGHITGTVQGADANPLPGVQVHVDVRAYTTVTDAQGQFTIPNVLPNDYAVTLSRHGYVTQTIDITLDEDETEVMNVTMNLMAQVAVSGSILASDTGSGIAGASITLVGYENYTGSSTGNGSFSIPSVFANHSYAYNISAAGYTSTSGTIDVGATNHSMGNLTLNEIAYAPNTVEVELNAGFTTANLSWNAPDPNAIEITEGFEGLNFPPADWTQTITNAGPANALGVKPTWCSFGTIDISGNVVMPTEGFKQAGLWWDYEHQDEWLFTPSFNCPPDGYLSFDTYSTLGSPNEDHYYVQISIDGGNNWTVLWDASANATEIENHYAYPITVDMAAYAGMEVMLAFHAVDPPSNDGLWFTWFIDNIYIGNFAETVRFAGLERSTAKAIDRSSNAGSGNTPSRLARAESLRNSGFVRSNSIEPSSSVRSTNRLLTGYKVWRFIAGQESNETNWTALTPEMITTLNFADEGWATIPNGTYKWAVKAVYTSDVISAPAFSNSLVKEVVTGNIVGFVRKQQNNQGIAGATVTAEGGFSATTNTAGAYSLNVPAGIYSVSATAAGYDSLSQENIAVAPNQNTTVNFLMSPVSNVDEQVPITVTALRGNYPNPFNPETTIRYDIKDASNVRLTVYNVKGQLVRNLVNTDQAAGRYRVIFNGRDDKGNPLSSGIYLYRFSAGKYSSTRKMMLME